MRLNISNDFKKEFRIKYVYIIQNLIDSLLVQESIPNKKYAKMFILDPMNTYLFSVEIKQNEVTFLNKEKQRGCPLTFLT